MYNKEILNELMRRYTTEEIILFCQMEAVKNDLLAKDSKDPLTEFTYERDWWNDTGVQLQRELTND